MGGKQVPGTSTSVGVADSQLHRLLRFTTPFGFPPFGALFNGNALGSLTKRHSPALERVTRPHPSFRIASDLLPPRIGL